MENVITTISIPKALAEKLKKKMEGTGFRSLSSYVTYILRQIVSSIEMEKQSENQSEKEAFSKTEEEAVKARLRALGYLD